MAIIDYWIQLEHRPWDCCPNGRDRMTGQHFTPLGVLNGHNFYKGLGVPDAGPKPGKPWGEDALIFRRYTANWAAPDDRKINPWDLNEPDPTNTGTKGTIPGPVIECNVGDEVHVHFRNMDFRAGFDVLSRTHSMHPHGFVFKNTSDGAYPLSPPDTSQPVGAEAADWALVGVGPNKMGDRVPPNGTFTYTWTTQNWPSTAGVWLYHDHSVCDMDNVSLGAIGIIVIHNLADTNNDFVITPLDLPNGSFNGSPVVINCFPFDPPIATLPHDLSTLAVAPGLGANPGITVSPAVATMPGMTATATRKKKGAAAATPATARTAATNVAAAVGPPVLERLIERDGALFELDTTLKTILRFCTRNYRKPPLKAMYLMLFHEFSGAPGMAINGRVYLGNTPTMIAGTATKMRFGVVGMGAFAFHTFHVHGHRWIVPGPDGNTPNAIQASPQVKSISQFEDTRIFGPANSFGFTIDETVGSFMRAGGKVEDDAKGEWHMHCHVLQHMMDGMMGSLLVIGKAGGETASTLPEGKPCPKPATGATHTITVTDFKFTPNAITIPSGDTITFDFQAPNHSVTTTGTMGASPHIEINGGGPTAATATTPIPSPGTRSVTLTGAGMINYHCGIHGTGMAGTITIT